MSVSITLTQTNTVYNDDDDQPVYKSENVIEGSEGIPLALFVFSVTDESYSHVASTRDVEAWENTKNEAINNGDDYYRQAQVTREFDNITEALAFALHVRTRLQYLCNDYPTTQEEFEGTTVYTLTTSES